jgi:hypothetical protein
MIQDLQSETHFKYNALDRLTQVKNKCASRFQRYSII